MPAKKVVNKMGTKAYDLGDKEALVTSVLTSFFNEPKAHGDTSPALVENAKKVLKTEPVFVAKLAAFARNVFHMRTVSQVLAAETAKGAKGNPIVRKMIRKVIERPDDMTNIIAYHLEKYGPRKDATSKISTNPIPRSLRRGIADIFGKFTEYDLAKYKQDDQAVKLRDVLLITRPKPKDAAQAALWKKLIEGTLETPETRETILTEKGQSKEVWEGMIDDKKLGYMALLRNVKNMLTHDVSQEHIMKVCARLTDPKAVEKSKQLPFRFFSAYEMVCQECHGPKAEQIKDALEEAIQLSAKNIPHLSGTTFMTADESGSMSSLVSSKGKLKMVDIGNLLMALGSQFCEKCIASVFGDTFKTVPVQGKGVFKDMEKIRKVGDQVGMSTIMSTSIDWLNSTGTKVDRIVVFSDMQAYEHSLRDRGDTAGSIKSKLDLYRKNVNPDVWVHSIDLAGHGTTLVKGEKVNLIAGWSEKIFDYIVQSESGSGSLIEEIEKYEL